MHPADLGSFVLKGGSGSITNAVSGKPMEVDTTDAISDLDDVQPIEFESAISRFSVTDNNAGKSVLVCKFSYKSSETVETVANLD